MRAQTHPLVGHASLSVTRIAGGIGDNVMPENCEMVLDRRLLPGETLDAALDELDAMLTRARREHGVEAESRRSAPGPARRRPRSTIRSCQGGRHLPRAWRDLSAARRADGGCDLVHFHDVGAVGVVLGPGSLDVAHQPDEYVPKDDLARAALIYRDIAVAMMRP